MNVSAKDISILLYKSWTLLEWKSNCSNILLDLAVSTWDTSVKYNWRLLHFLLFQRYQQSNWEFKTVSFKSGLYQSKKVWSMYFSGVFFRRQLMKSQLSCQMFIKKLLFLVCYFFSVICNISKLNDLKTKCKLNCQNEFFGKLFLKSGNSGFVSKTRTKGISLHDRKFTI